jgi:hypothetical protein
MHRMLATDVQSVSLLKEVAEALFVRNFSGFDYVVAPSASGVHHVQDNFDAIEQTDVVKLVRARTYELVEFLHDILVPMKFIHIAEILNGASV